MEHHICPWYIGYLLANPIRRLIQNPDTILGSHVKEGMRILEVGPGMGFFTIPMARLAGSSGRIFAVDLQEKMLNPLRRKAARAGLSERIIGRICSQFSLQIDDLTDSIDLAVLFAVVHEVPDQNILFTEVHRALKKDGILFVAEPTGHVTGAGYQAMLSLLTDLGFIAIETPTIQHSMATVMKKG